MKGFIIRVCLLVFVTSFLLQVAAQTSLAASFNYASLRLNRSAVNSALSGFVCATPSSAGAGTEDSVTVTFPNSFSISGTASNWTVSTSGIPAGTTAWPGIATASSVSGKAVTFPSNDLTSGATRYCFAYTGASSTTGSSTGSQEGSLTTKNSSNTTIDTSTVAVYVGNDQVSLSATVPASASDFDADIEQTSPSSTTVNQDETITYKITYGSSLSYATGISVRASWSQGTISGSSTPSLDIANYVIGSASTGYGGATPVIDTVNRTITWTISSFPGNTNNQTVTFQLKTTDAFTGSESVTFTTSGKVIGPGTETTASTVTNTYKYAGATPTSTPGPTNTPTPGSNTPTPTLTPTPGPNSPIQIESVDLRSITATSARVQVVISKANSVEILYGTASNKLSQKVTSLDSSKVHTLELTGLTPKTQYYFTVLLPNQKTTSDIFTFTTASSSSTPVIINQDTLIVVSNNIILMDPFLEQTVKKPIVVLPAGDSFQVKFSFENSRRVKRVQLFIQNSSVLGVSTTLLPQADAAGYNTNMVRIRGNEYAGRLRAPEEPGIYKVFAQIYEENGSLTEEKVTDLKSSKPFTVYGLNGKPIENAEVTLEYFDTSEKRFLSISNQGLDLQNPSYSNYKGIVRLTLPDAQYRTTVKAFGHKSQTITFTIGPEEDQNYPQVYLEKEAFSPISFTTYYVQTLLEILDTTFFVMTTMAHSPRVASFLAATASAVCIILPIIVIASRSYLKLNLPGFFARRFPGFINKRPFKLKITDQNGRAINQATIHVLRNETLVSTLYSGRNGLISASIQEGDTLEIVKEEYVSKTVSSSECKKNIIQEIKLETHENSVLLVGKSAHQFLRKILGMIFELLLIGGVIFESLIMITGDPIKTLPFLLITILNVFLWILYRRQ